MASQRFEDRLLKGGATMSFMNIMIGYFFGFMLGAGCSLAIMYAIYRGGYRKAVSDSLKDPQPETFVRAVAQASKRG
jgi:hypothetical protein